jgi:phage shock protein A
MRNLELKIAELKAKKDMYIARSRSAEARYRLEEMLNGISAVSSLDLWKRMEEKVTQIEADTEVLSLTRNDELAKKFATLESIKDVDTELSAMKTRIFPVDK